METSLPTPVTARVYVNLPEGIKQGIFLHVEVSNPWGFPKSWMVDVMENPNLKWMTGGSPMTKETSINSKQHAGHAAIPPPADFQGRLLDEFISDLRGNLRKREDQLMGKLPQ
jgi:hypothetical protein